MTERPILFSGPMVRAILSGQKTVTRRVVKPWQVPTQQEDGTWFSIAQKHPRWGFGVSGKSAEECASMLPMSVCPYGQPGDRLWVRETFAVYGDEKMHAIHYRADRPEHVGQKSMGYKPSIHMPRWASRILLEITAVRVERLQDISEEQAEAEGTQGCVPYCQSPYDSDGAPACDCMNLTYKESFHALWSSINGTESWAANPWVWVVEFKRVTP